MTSIAALADVLHAEERDRIMSHEDTRFEGPRLFERARRVMADGIRHQHAVLGEDGAAAPLEARLNRVRALELG